MRDRVGRWNQRILSLVRRAWLEPEGVEGKTRKTRTLTTLYNRRPAWLANAHAVPNRTAYGWDVPELAAVPEDELLARLLALNLARAGGQDRAGT